jgi:hypothetical protein
MPSCQAGTERMLWFLLLALRMAKGTGEMKEALHERVEITSNAEARCFIGHCCF